MRVYTDRVSVEEGFFAKETSEFFIKDIRSIDVRQGGIVWTIDNAAIGSGARYRIAGKVERSFYPGGRSDPEVESTIDYAPNQQWPHPNPRWVELGAPPASPAA